MIKLSALLFIISTFFVAPARAGVVSTCAKILRGQSVEWAGDVGRILDVYDHLPFEIRMQFEDAYEGVPEQDLQKWVSFYKKWSLAALPLFLGTIVGYVASVAPDSWIDHSHYSNTVLLAAILNIAYSNAATNYPTARKRLLLKLALISMGLNLYWELGPLETGLERLPPQCPRVGTDWGDLISGVATSALFVPFIKTIEAVCTYAQKHKTSLDLDDNRANSTEIQP